MHFIELIKPSTRDMDQIRSYLETVIASTNLRQIPSARELFLEARQKEIPSGFHITSDYAWFTVEDNKPVVYFGQENTNPLLTSYKRFIDGFSNGVIDLIEEDVHSIMRSSDTLRVEYGREGSNVFVQVGEECGIHVKYIEGQPFLRTMHPGLPEEPREINFFQSQVLERFYGPLVQLNDWINSMRNAPNPKDTDVYLYVEKPVMVTIGCGPFSGPNLQKGFLRACVVVAEENLAVYATSPHIIDFREDQPLYIPQKDA